jgi:hypothetical protein
MSEEPTQQASADTDRLSLPEEVQLVLQTVPGRLHFGWEQVAAAALVELALAERVGSVPNRGLFTGGKARLLTVVNAAPTGSPLLDLALELVVAHQKPWVAYKCVLAIGRELSLAVHAQLVRKGIVSVVGEFPSLSGYLQVEDEPRQQAVKDKLDRARALPDQVTDPRTGALADVLRNAGNLFDGGPGIGPRMLREWYPENVRDTVDAILQGEGLIARSQ